MRYSKLFGKTVRKVPKDARLTSHKLLFKGGFIRRFSTGRWGFLPLGMRVWLKIVKIIEEEMEAIGCQRLIVPTLHPIEIWQATARDQAFGEEMLAVNDHHGATFALGATAEGMMLELVKMFRPSYKDLPIDIYQFSQKFRDDKRPRGGLLRVREFMMKDAYNFCADEKQLLKGYQKYYHAYLKIAKRLGLKVTPALADSGAIGGGLSHEFMLESTAGDQTYFICNQCGYAANVEKAEFFKDSKNPKEKELPLKEVEAKRGTKMEDGVKLHQKPLWRQIKDVMFVDEKGGFVLAIIRGDFQVNETKLKNLAGAKEFRQATDEEIKKKLHSWPGFISPVGIKKNLAPGVKLTIIADESLKSVKNAYGGSNKKFRDLLNINYGRDYQPDIEGDLAQAQSGEKCAACQKGKLEMKKGFEWGHTFKIDLLYSKSQKGYYVDQKGNRQLLWMGSYGIGIGRTMALIVETYHDQKGIIWPKQVAPYQAHLINLKTQMSNVKSKSQNSKLFADAVYDKLVKAGIEVLYDDRDISAGVKFADADLIGLPVRLVVSAKTGKKIEWKKRGKKQKELLGLKETIKRLQSVKNML